VISALNSLVCLKLLDLLGLTKYKIDQASAEICVTVRRLQIQFLQW
tara:strand:- start:449 stop:586 length:138 start_codon:yes stop_codon:yes gene_type:complete